ncbi:hypothetical protein HDC37_000847 [Microbacterium sp. AK009]|uniref:hypothetical protein n=1 Tax=Microbacterium sp. AK009 TaxID=2723068 RepID=UPI0015CCCC66|nr:hypothetical protein [Microbacterium sp. AK009]NYF16033.1 hypothetical protein [Microbacterium sp. AK009]
MHRRAAILLLTLGAMTLAGCSTSSGVPELDRPSEEQDRPGWVIDGDLVVPGSIRYAGASGDVEVYLARGTDEPNAVCVLVARDGRLQGSACGGSGGVGLKLGDGIQLEVGDYRLPGDAERTPISESVRLVGDPQ